MFVLREGYMVGTAVATIVASRAETKRASLTVISIVGAGREDGVLTYIECANDGECLDLGPRRSRGLNIHRYDWSRHGLSVCSRRRRVDCRHGSGEV